MANLIVEEAVSEHKREAVWVDKMTAGCLAFLKDW